MSVWKLGSLLLGSSGGRAPALGRCEGDLGAGIFEDIVRRRQFLQPEAGLAPRAAELVVGGKNHQDFQDVLLSLIVVPLSFAQTADLATRSAHAKLSNFGTPDWLSKTRVFERDRERAAKSQSGYYGKN